MLLWGGRVKPGAARVDTKAGIVFAIAAHLRIRILLAIAVVVIGGGVFAVTEVQRASDAVSFEEYTSARELRNAAFTTAFAFSEALEHGPAAADDVAAAERAVASATAGVQTHLERRDGSERKLIEEQNRALVGLVEVANRPLARGQHDALALERDALFDRFLAANDELLTRLVSDRKQAFRSAARRPVMLVVGLFLLFGLLHLLLVERPASRARARRRAQGEFVDAMQVARSEAEAYDVLSRHVERSADALHVTVLNRNNSADRLEPVTPVEPESSTAQGLEGATPIPVSRFA